MRGMMVSWLKTLVLRMLAAVEDVGKLAASSAVRARERCAVRDDDDEVSTDASVGGVKLFVKSACPQGSISSYEKVEQDGSRGECRIGTNREECDLKIDLQDGLATT